MHITVIVFVLPLSIRSYFFLNCFSGYNCLILANDMSTIMEFISYRCAMGTLSEVQLRLAVSLFPTTWGSKQSGSYDSLKN